MRLFRRFLTPYRLASLSGSGVDSIEEHSTARTLYLDALRLFYCTSALYRYFQNAVLEAGTDLALISSLGQGKAAAEGAVAALPYVVAAPLLLLGLALT